MTDSDIDLIRAAGKAAGLKLQLALGFTEHDRGLFTSEGKEWNPLTDDGDAFRLAVALGIGLGIDMQDEIVTAYAPNPNPRHFSEDAHDADKYAATRRAIVRAAAAIGAKGE